MGKVQLKVQQHLLQAQPWVVVKYHNGLAIITVMMKTIILNVVLMEVTVVEMMSTPSTALNVNVLSFHQRQHKPLMDQIVKYHIGLAITTVTMKTIILNVVMMVVTVVETMLTPCTALNV